MTFFDLLSQIHNCCSCTVGPNCDRLSSGRWTYVRRLTPHCDWSASRHRKSRDHCSDEWRQWYSAVPITRKAVTRLYGVHNRLEHKVSCYESACNDSWFGSSEFCWTVQFHAWSCHWKRHAVQDYYQVSINCLHTDILAAFSPLFILFDQSSVKCCGDSCMDVSYMPKPARVFRLQSIWLFKGKKYCSVTYRLQLWI